MPEQTGSKWFNPGELTQTGDLSLSRDRKGLWTGRQGYYCQKADLINLVPERESEHPDFPFLLCDDVQVTGEEKGWCKIEARYYGALSTSDSTSINEDNPPEYSLDLSVSEEPLETHPRYVDNLTVAEIQEAVDKATNPPKDKAGELKVVDQAGWGAGKIELYDFLRGGLVSYRDPKVSWSESWVDDEMPNLNKIGEIVANPAGNPPALAAGRNWLLTGIKMVPRGGIFECSKVYEASGRGGWKTVLYS